MSEPTSGPVPSVASRIPRGIALGLAIACLGLGVGYLFGRRAPPPPAEAASDTGPDAPDVFIGLPPPTTRDLGPSRVIEPQRRPPMQRPEPRRPQPPASDFHLELPQLDFQARAPVHASPPAAAMPPPRVVVQPPPVAPPATASTASLPALPPPAFLVTDAVDDEAARLAELEQHLLLREHGLRAIDGAAMVRIEGAKFTMGDSLGFENESPEHEVDVETFWIDQFEVSIGQAIRYNEAADETGHGRIRLQDDRPELPLAEVSWAEAEIYCEWVGGSLPTETQWELAARALDARDWPWGSGFNLACANLFLEDASLREAMPVDSLPCGAAPGDVRHLCGNVAEWTLDDYGLYARSSSSDAASSFGTRKVVRGGSFLTRNKQDATTHAREAERPGSRRSDLGFRCVLPHAP